MGFGVGLRTNVAAGVGADASVGVAAGVGVGAGLGVGTGVGGRVTVGARADTAVGIGTGLGVGWDWAHATPIVTSRARKLEATYRFLNVATIRQVTPPAPVGSHSPRRPGLFDYRIHCVRQVSGESWQ